ncbi:MAG: flagellar M-ring protein FliF [Proteobacteria bacterium]|nr:flagellar M-ring protein FliF [Pseudomonadota bacterium]MBU1737327.1 flagellar M-ring protein FliF [Pseudomonadota bacterium]
MGQRVAALLLVAVVVGGLMSITTVGGRLDQKVLYSGLAEEDAAEVVARLKDLRTPYTLENNGTTIMVPANQVYETRLSLAGEGLPRGGGVGFEIFDKTSFGTTDFVQRMNYQRALQGELARTIRQFHQVLEARVHLATPKESVFIEDEKPVTASISVKLRGNAGLSKLQISSIVNLVATAVPGLSSDNVTLVDTTGRLLYRKDGESGSIMTATQLEYQQHLENSLRQKVESMLEEVVGVNKVKARVTADIDFNRVNVTEENFDPEGQVIRSEQFMVEGDNREGLDPGGVPGAKGDLASFAGTGSGGAAANGYQRNNITRNYEVSRVTRQTQEASGIIKRLSVAVMVDGKYEAAAAGEGETPVLTYVPRSAEELAWFDKLVKNTIGYNEERADQVEVVSMSFAASTTTEPKETLTDKLRPFLDLLLMPMVYLGLALMVLLLVIRPLFKVLTSPSAMSSGALPGNRFQTVVGGDMGGMMPSGDEDISLMPKGMTDKEKMYKLAQTDPDRAADLVRRWLREGV